MSNILLKEINQNDNPGLFKAYLKNASDYTKRNPGWVVVFAQEPEGGSITAFTPAAWREEYNKEPWYGALETMDFEKIYAVNVGSGPHSMLKKFTIRLPQGHPEAVVVAFKVSDAIEGESTRDITNAITARTGAETARADGPDEVPPNDAKNLVRGIKNALNKQDGKIGEIEKACPKSIVPETVTDVATAGIALAGATTAATIGLTRWSQLMNTEIMRQRPSRPTPGGASRGGRFGLVPLTLIGLGTTGAAVYAGVSNADTDKNEKFNTTWAGGVVAAVGTAMLGGRAVRLARKAPEKSLSSAWRWLAAGFILPATVTDDYCWLRWAAAGLILGGMVGVTLRARNLFKHQQLLKLDNIKNSELVIMKSLLDEVNNLQQTLLRQDTGWNQAIDGLAFDLIAFLRQIEADRVAVDSSYQGFASRISAILAREMPGFMRANPATVLDDAALEAFEKIPNSIDEWRQFFITHVSDFDDSWNIDQVLDRWWRTNQVSGQIDIINDLWRSAHRQARDTMQLDISQYIASANARISPLVTKVIRAHQLAKAIGNDLGSERIVKPLVEWAEKQAKKIVEKGLSRHADASNFAAAIKNFFEVHSHLIIGSGGATDWLVILRSSLKDSAKFSGGRSIDDVANKIEKIIADYMVEASDIIRISVQDSATSGKGSLAGKGTKSRPTRPEANISKEGKAKLAAAREKMKNDLLAELGDSRIEKAFKSALKDPPFNVTDINKAVDDICTAYEKLARIEGSFLATIVEIETVFQQSVDAIMAGGGRDNVSMLAEFTDRFRAAIAGSVFNRHPLLTAAFEGQAGLTTGFMDSAKRSWDMVGTPGTMLFNLKKGATSQGAAAIGYTLAAAKAIEGFMGDDSESKTEDAKKLFCKYYNALDGNKLNKFQGNQIDTLIKITNKILTQEDQVLRRDRKQFFENNKGRTMAEIIKDDIESKIKDEIFRYLGFGEELEDELKTGYSQAAADVITGFLVGQKGRLGGIKLDKLGNNKSAWRQMYSNSIDDVNRRLKNEISQICGPLKEYNISDLRVLVSEMLNEDRGRYTTDQMQTAAEKPAEDGWGGMDRTFDHSSWSSLEQARKYTIEKSKVESEIAKLEADCDLNGQKFIFMHLNEDMPTFFEGGKVRVGDIIGHVGRSGMFDPPGQGGNPHIHFEVHKKGSVVNGFQELDLNGHLDDLNPLKLPSGNAAEWKRWIDSGKDSNFGQVRGKARSPHKGIDINQEYGTPIYSPVNGILKINHSPASYKGRVGRLKKKIAEHNRRVPYNFTFKYKNRTFTVPFRKEDKIFLGSDKVSFEKEDGTKYDPNFNFVAGIRSGRRSFAAKMKTGATVKSQSVREEQEETTKTENVPLYVILRNFLGAERSSFAAGVMITIIGEGNVKGEDMEAHAALKEKIKLNVFGIESVDESGVNENMKKTIKENSGQGYSKYPYNPSVGDDDEPAEDYIEEWKALSIELIRDESRATAIEIAKLLVKDLELFEDVLDLAGQNQSVGTEILSKLKQAREKS